MSEFQIAANPFGMMINPEAVIDAMNRSDRLERLQRRVYRPLDKPMLPKSGESGSEADGDDIDADLIQAQSAQASEARPYDVGQDLSDVIAVSPRNLAF